VKDASDDPPITALFNYCHSRFPLDVLETLLKQGCDPNASYPIPGLTPRKDVTVLETALGSFSRSGSEVMEDHRAAVRKLLDYGARFPGIKSAADHALLVAAARGDLKKIQDAVAEGASVNAKETFGYAPMLISATLGYFDNLVWLLEQGADPRQSYTGLGGSLLPAAVEANRADIVRLLIAKGLDLSQTAGGLSAAVENGNQEIFDTLIKAGANPKEANLFRCIQNGRVEMARVLLQLGVDPQPPPMMENRGNVYWAVYYDQPEILKMLLEHGANPALVDAYGETPLAMAKKFHKEMAPILEEAIAKRGMEGKKDDAK
jgi:ankyrin repeat protein